MFLNFFKATLKFYEKKKTICHLQPPSGVIKILTIISFFFNSFVSLKPQSLIIHL